MTEIGHTAPGGCGGTTGENADQQNNGNRMHGSVRESWKNRATIHETHCRYQRAENSHFAWPVAIYNSAAFNTALQNSIQYCCRIHCLIH